MILLAGAFELFPLLLVVLLAIAVSLSGSLVSTAFGAALPGAATAGIAFVSALLTLLFVIERTLAARARRAPRWVANLDTIAGAPLESVGGKALDLARIAGMGTPIPEGIVLTTALVDAIAAAVKAKTPLDRVVASLPKPARRDIEAFLARSKGKLIVRASFTGQRAEHSFAGVFPAVRDVEPRRTEELVAAVLDLLPTGNDSVGQEYARRVGAEIVARAVVVQRQIDAETFGAIASRGPGGRADAVTVDYSRRRAPARSLVYDLTDGRTTSPSGEEQSAETPAWMHRLAVLAVVLESEFGSAVEVEIAIDRGQPYVLDVRRLHAADRKTWVHAAPLDAPFERQPTFAQELRGGLSLARRVLSGMLERAGAPGAIDEAELRYADGLVYVDAEVIRRALARLGRDVLLRGGLGATLRSIAPVRKRPLPSVPTVTEVSPQAWSALRKWHERHLLGAAQVRLELVAREWLIRTLLRLTDGTGASAEERRGHPALRWLLSRRVRQAAAEAARQRTVLEQAETELGSAVARLLALGVAGFQGMFKGDRHLHATLEEIDQFHADATLRDGLEKNWKSRRVAFDQRKDQPVLARVFRPAFPEAPADAIAGGTSVVPSARAAVQKLRGVAVVGGVARGPAVLQGSESGTSAGAILLLNDGRTELCPHVYAAHGIVLLSGGLVSPVARLAREIGVPIVHCPAARAFVTRDVTIDGAVGTVTVHR